MNVTEDKSKDRQLHNEGHLQMVRNRESMQRRPLVQGLLKTPTSSQTCRRLDCWKRFYKAETLIRHIRK